MPRTVTHNTNMLGSSEFLGPGRRTFSVGPQLRAKSRFSRRAEADVENRRSVFHGLTPAGMDFSDAASSRHPTRSIRLGRAINDNFGRDAQKLRTKPPLLNSYRRLGRRGGAPLRAGLRM